VIIGIGVDLFSVTRVEEDLEKGEKGLRDEIFTPEEIAYCQSKRYPAQHFAARFAAKEAVFKRSERSGRSFVHLNGKVRETADALGVAKIYVSLSHTRDWAVASVVMEAADGRSTTLPS
jgi:holo-[acyl-carrier protein] synthase